MKDKGVGDVFFETVYDILEQTHKALNLETKKQKKKKNTWANFKFSSRQVGAILDC